jgi:hypothetical protein
VALSKAAILAANDIKVSAPVPVPEWNGEVYIKTLLGTERDQFEDAISDKKTRRTQEMLLVMTLCDENGKRLFDDKDVEALAEKSSLVTARLFEKAWDLNGFSAKAGEQLGEGSPDARKEGSTSA